MTGLETKLNAILNDKLTNLTPENLKKDVTCLGVTGTYEGSGGGSIVEGVKQFSTVEEMNSSTGNTEGDLAIIYRNEIQNATADSQFRIATFPDTVVLNSAITDYTEFRYIAVDSSVTFGCTGSLDSSMFTMNYYTETRDVIIQYTSYDGITYTRDDTTGNPVDFGTEIYYEMSEMWNDAIGKFIQIGGSTFEGLYKYSGTTWELAPTDLTTVADEVYLTKFYGKNGVETGTLTTSVSNSFADTNAAVYGNIQQAYDSLTPRVLTNTDKDIDKNIYFIPTKTDGTILLDTSNVTNMYTMFSDCKNLTEIPLLNTSNATNMNSMFSGCTNLTTIPQLNTSNVTNMGYMFNNCKNLAAMPLLNTSNVTNMGSMFSNCSNLTIIPLLDTNKVTDMTSMFNGCTNITTVPNFNTSNVTYMYRMFQNCTNLTTIPLLDTSNVDNIGYMFGGCTNLTEIPLLDTSNVTDIGYMFSDCKNLTTIPQLNTSKATNTGYMFSRCTNLTEIPLLDTSNVTNMGYMFRGCTNLTTIPQLNTSKATNMGYMFSGCSSLSDNSLNNVLAMCTNATAYTGTKTLKNIGLTSDQATKCATLSNYSTFTAAGWTTGY